MEHDFSSRQQTKEYMKRWSCFSRSRTEWSNENSQRCFQLASDEFGHPFNFVGKIRGVEIRVLFNQTLT